MNKQTTTRFPDSDFDTWAVPFVSSTDGSVLAYLAQGVFSFYFGLVATKQMSARTLLSNFHYLTGGSQEAFDWMYKEIAHIEPDRDALLKKYRAFDQSNPECVGPLFMHYFVACDEGWHGTYEDFCHTHQIGDELLMPILASKVEEATV